MTCMLREPKKKGGRGGSDQRLDIGPQFSLSQKKIAKENYFHTAVLFRGYTLSNLRINITAYTAAHAELILKPYIISHHFSDSMLKAMKIR